MIEKLYDGRISPATRNYGKDEEYALALQRTTEAEEVLRGRLSPADYPVLDVFINCNSHLSYRTSELDFKEGFALAAVLALDLYTHSKSDHP